MLYAVVDIETTGSYAAANGITEIAIVIHDGNERLNFYQSLVNPHIPIPYFIQKLTGINNEMLVNAPSFPEIASIVHDLLHDKVFVAHNVNFDYSFVKHQLAVCGYELDTKKLCTVRLARKVLPGLPGYSLSKLTHVLGINHANAHRAGADALATADLLSIIVKSDSEGAIVEMLKGKNKESYIPPHIPVEDIEQLPPASGVYYFLSRTGKTIYIGKAKNIKKRVKSHFSNNTTGKQKQDFLKEIFRVSYRLCGTELMASVLESAEIRRLWPRYNRSQKGYLPDFALLSYQDRHGYIRFTIEKNKAVFKPVYTFNSITEGTNKLKEMVSEFGLCAKLCNLMTSPDCGCEEHPEPDTYNKKALEAIDMFRKRLPTFALIDKGIEDNDYSCILVLEGNISGMGYFSDKQTQLKNLEALQKNIEPIKNNEYIRNLVIRHAIDYPEKCVAF